MTRWTVAGSWPHATLPGQPLQPIKLSAALVEWNRERLAIRLPLGRLTLDGTCAMLCGLLGLDTVSDEYAQLIQRETEGNPFFVEEVIKSLIEQGQIYREGDHWERKEIADLTVPQSVREAIGRRLNRLDKACLDVPHTAAALGKTFAFEELAAAYAIQHSTTKRYPTIHPNASATAVIDCHTHTQP